MPGVVAPDQEVICLDAAATVLREMKAYPRC